MVRIKVDAILVSQTILPLMENGILGVTVPRFQARPHRALGGGHLIRRDCHRQVAQEEREGEKSSEPIRGTQSPSSHQVHSPIPDAFIRSCS